MTRRLALVGTGTALLVAGAAVLGWGAWQYAGTNVAAERAQARTIDRLEQQWRRLPASEIEPAGSPAGSPGPTAELGDALALVRVPRFGDDYVMPVVEGVDEAALSTGLGHFEGSAGPGRPGNFAVAGHRVTHGEPLRQVDDLAPGDLVLVETARATYTYEIDTADLEVDHDAAWVIDPEPTNPDADGVGPAEAPALLTLVTCADVFRTDERTVVFGHLVATAPK